MLQVNSLTPPFPPTYTPPGDGQKYLIPGYTILQPYQTAFLTTNNAAAAATTTTTTTTTTETTTETAAKMQQKNAGTVPDE